MGFKQTLASDLEVTPNHILLAEGVKAYSATFNFCVHYVASVNEEITSFVDLQSATDGNQIYHIAYIFGSIQF